MTTKNRDAIIADTSGLISLIVQNDHNHGAAVKAAMHLKKVEKDILIPEAVYVELINVLGRKANHNFAVRAVEELTPPFYLIGDLGRFPEAINKFEELPQGVSFTDCIVMAIADEFSTKEIFGFDKQFEDAGYGRLTPSSEW